MSVYFQCPGCGRSFEVKSAKSQRIFCSAACKNAGGEMPPAEIERALALGPPDFLGTEPASGGGEGRA